MNVRCPESRGVWRGCTGCLTPHILTYSPENPEGKPTPRWRSTRNSVDPVLSFTHEKIMAWLEKVWKKLLKAFFAAKINVSSLGTVPGSVTFFLFLSLDIGDSSGETCPAFGWPITRRPRSHYHHPPPFSWRKFKMCYKNWFVVWISQRGQKTTVEA